MRRRVKGREKRMLGAKFLGIVLLVFLEVHGRERICLAGFVGSYGIKD
jgi:hypothetical protein